MFIVTPKDKTKLLLLIAHDLNLLICHCNMFRNKLLQMTQHSQGFVMATAAIESLGF